MFVENFSLINISNAYFEKGYNLYLPIFDFESINSVLLNNITILNVNNTSGSKNIFINLENFETTQTTVSNINVSNCETNSGVIIESQLPLDKLTLIDGYFSNIYVEADSNLIIIDSIKSIYFQNLDVTNIYCNESNDLNSKFLLVSGLNIEDDQNSTMDNIVFTSSTISFMMVEGIQNNSTVGYFFNVTNMTFINLTYSQPKALIQFSQFSYQVNLTFTFTNCIFSNIQFEYNGLLFLLGERMYTPVIISNSTFQNLTAATIHLKPQDISDLTIIDMLNITDSTFDNINSASDSFIVAFEHGRVTVHRCTFTNMYSYESGAVMYGAYDNSQFYLYDSSFINNTSVQGSVFLFDNYAIVHIYNCTIKNNFSLLSGVAYITGGSQVTFLSCVISNNIAISISVADCFEGYSILTFSNCSISDNLSLTQDQVNNELNVQCDNLCFVPFLFKEYIKSNPGVLSFAYSENAINSVYSSLNIINQTSIKNQNTLIASMISEVLVQDSSITNITIVGEPNISLVYSSFIINNINISEVVSTKGFDFIQSIEDCIINFTSVKFTNSSSTFINTISTIVQLENTTFEGISSNREIISIDSSNGNLFNNVSIINCTSQSNRMILISNCNSFSIINLRVEALNTTMLPIKNSAILNIENILITNCNQGFIFENSVITIFKNSFISSNGDSNVLYGGAIRSINSDILITNSTFINNRAISGGAISFECDSLSNCNLSLDKILFDSNIAISQGGALYYNFNRPQFNQNIYINNQAIYGNDIASYAVKVRFNESDSDHMSITDIASGIRYDTNIVFKLLDFDNQTMILNNINQVELISSNTSQIQLKGTNNGLLKNGIAIFNNFIAISEPGNSNILISVKCKAIDKAKINTIFGSEIGNSLITTNFRYCKPGELRMTDNTCNKCAAGTYSLLWNSTSCNQCVTNTVCQGEYIISVDKGYWRNTKNSTYIAECLYKDACQGGYSEENEHPVNCSEGYSGILCNDCQILNGFKYERVSDYQCERCPNPIYNGVRVIGLLLLVFIFLMILIIINIRKTNESEMSILIRIMTNYLQLLTTSMSFNVKYPSALINALSPVSQVGSSSQAFLSFDCFITDTQLKGPFPSNSFFKLFLTGVLPFALIGLISLIWVCVRLIKPSLMKNLTRNIVISFISIVFFLHPKLASTSVSIFECVKIDEGIYKVRINTSMDCYSGEHIYWCFLLGVSILAFWVIFLPLFALALLFKNIHRGENSKINTYFLILYQDLKKNCFYWEFVNSLRKVLILIIFAALTTFSPLYRIVLSVIVLTITARVQIYLDPYKNSKHSEIELLAIIAGTTTLFSGLIYTSSTTVNLLNTLVLACIFSFNIIFILEWLLLLFVTLSERFKFLIKLVFLIELILCKRFKSIHKNIEEVDECVSEKSSKIVREEFPVLKKRSKRKMGKILKEGRIKKKIRFASLKENMKKKSRNENIKVIECGDIDEVVREDTNEDISSITISKCYSPKVNRIRTTNINILDQENSAKCILADFKTKRIQKIKHKSKTLANQIKAFSIVNSDNLDKSIGSNWPEVSETFKVKKREKTKEFNPTTNEIMLAIVSSDFSNEDNSKIK